MGRSFTEFKVPGSAVFHADEPGEYKVFLLTNSVASGDYRNSSEDEPKGLVVSVVRKADGQKPSLSQSMNETFTAGSKSGKSLFAFQADQAGDYVVTGQIGESGAEAGPSTVVLAVGKGFQWGSFGRMMLSGLLGGLIFLAGIVIAGVTIIRWAVFSRSDIPAQPPRI